MSKSKPIPKLISRFEIGFDDETKAEISALKSKIDELTRGLSAKDGSHGERLLAAMQAEAANDTPKPALEQMGQWVFEGEPEYIESAGVDKEGHAYCCAGDKTEISAAMVDGIFKGTRSYWKCIAGDFDGSDWRNSAINRETVNDVEYLSDTPEDDDTALESPIFSDEELAEVFPQITQADMQLIFIKNLATTLIQRMHSMDRFSEDDCHIGGNKLMVWDILIYEPLNTYSILIRRNKKHKVADLLIFNNTGPVVDTEWHTLSEAFATLRTITEAELPAFLAALEACYA
ncbi:hypothetical protein [Psychrobacter sp. 72-O-c]|uniref:hypothetical protein n=1 Tax=Psychrobacter sp. 72-O-c TaxID=2774125 RepID=UPI0019187770|nr:hypothetical protein [Psychrobacter sp. 72-O-c]